MATFLAIWRQDGGCDYTIGCGIEAVTLEASDLEGARHKVLVQLVDDNYYGDEVIDSIKSVTIYEVSSSIRLEPKEWNPLRDAAKKTAKEAETARRELAELERLKAKYKGR